MILDVAPTLPGLFSPRCRPEIMVPGRGTPELCQWNTPMEDRREQGLGAELSAGSTLPEL